MKAGKGRKFCINGHLNGARAKACKICGVSFEKPKQPEPVTTFDSVEQLLDGLDTGKHKVYDKGGRGKVECKCGKFYGAKLTECPACGLSKEENVVKVNPYPDNWAEAAKQFALKLGMGGTAIYAAAKSFPKPTLTSEGIARWADDTTWDYYTERKMRFFLTMPALRSILRVHFQDKELTKAFNFLRKWEKELI